MFSAVFAFFFTTPWAALLTAGGAVALPILIHLLHRRRFRVVTWAAMRFLLAAQRKNTQRMRLEQWLLLAVRVLLLLLLVLAMAGVTPWAEEIWGRLFPNQALSALPGSRRTHKILVIDGSLSMARKVGDASCFDRAKTAAMQIAQEGMGGDGFSVVLMAAPPRPIVSEPSDDARKVADEIQALQLPHGNADLAATLNAVENMLQRSPAKFQEKEVYFLTDLQRASWTVRHAVSPLAAIQKIQAQARTVFIDVGSQDPFDNLAVTSLALEAPLTTTGGETLFRTTLHNYGDKPRPGVRLELLVGKARSAAGDPPFEMRLAAEKSEDLAAGQTKTVTFSHKFAAPGDYAVQVRIGSDDLDLDNGRAVIVSVKDSVSVMLVNGKPAVEPFDRATEFLHHALNPFREGQAPRNVSARPKVLTESQFADAGLGDLTPYDCVFLCDVARLSVAEVRRLEAHLRKGGGVVVCLGPRIDRDAYNRLLYRDGKGILPASLKEVRHASAKQYFSLSAAEDDYKQPPLDIFAADKDRAGLLAVRFRGYVVAKPCEKSRTILSFLLQESEPAKKDAAISSPSSAEREPAMIAWNPPVVETANGGATPGPRPGATMRGRVVLVTTTVNMDWTSWPISPSFPALMQELLPYAVAGRLREQAGSVGDILEEFLPLSDARLDATIVTPQGRSETTRTEDRDDAGILRWTDTDASGIYRAVVGPHPQDHLFAVNIPTTLDAQQACESDLSRTNRDELLAAYPGWNFQVHTDPHAVVHSGESTPSPDRAGSGMGMMVARYLLLALLALLLAESLLAWRFSHAQKQEPHFPAGEEGATRDGNARKARLGALWPLFGFSFLVLSFLGIGFVLVHASRTGDFLGFLPDSWRQDVETALGIPAPAAGESIRWRLEFTPYLRDAAADPWLACLIALLATGLVITIYKKESRTARRIDKVFLTGLRVGLVLLILTLFLPQLRLWFERQGWPDIVILIDDSRSMSTADQYQDPRVREVAEQLARSASLKSPERLQLAQALLAHPDAEGRDRLETLLSRHRVKVHVYRCSAGAERLCDIHDADEPSQRDEAVQAIRKLRAEGDASRLGSAVRQVLNDFRGSSLSAIVMLTDGVTSEGEDLAKVSRYASQLGVPLYFLGLGDAREAPDLQLHDLEVEDAVYVNDRLVFEARVTGRGYADLKSVTVTLHEKGKDKILAQQVVKIDPHGKPVKFRLTHRPTEPGEKIYVLDVPVQPDQAQPADSNPENNRLERIVHVRQAKLIKVLYVEGYARYEYRFVKNFLERESAEDPRNKTIDLKVLLLDAGEEYPKQDKSALAEFPSKVELNQFDVVLWGDVDPQHPKIGAKNLSALADFVRERGGGLLMIAGERFSPHAYRDSALADVLPIEVVSPEPTDEDRPAGYRPEPTPAGRLHPIFRFSPDEAENAAVWQGLPEIFWWSEGYRTKPAAEVLLVHPNVQAGPATRSAEAGNGEGHPLAVQQFVGAGRCMFFGINETWRWRRRENELRFNQFWVQTVRFLARSRLGRTELRLDRQTAYHRGEPIKVTVKFPDDVPQPASGTPVNVSVVRTLPSTLGKGEMEKWELALEEMKGYRGIYEGTHTTTPEGEYRFWLSAPSVSGPVPRAECRVVVPPGEMDRLRMNHEDMEHAAETTHGRFFTLADADRLFDALPAGTRVALNAPQPPFLLWNHPALFAGALVLLGTEWFLRKRRHLV